MFLPILAVWILLTVSAEPGHVNLPCCNAGTDGVNGKILQCLEQKPRASCQKHFYVIFTKDGPACIKPDSKWLQNKIQKGQLNCLSEDDLWSSSSGSSRRESSGSVTVSRKSRCALQL